MDRLAKPTCCPYAPGPHRHNHVTGNHAHGKGHGTTGLCLPCLMVGGSTLIVANDGCG